MDMNEQTLNLESRAENVVLVEKLIDEICESYKVNEDYYGNILIAVTEAVNNAITHGNKANPGKKVKVEFKANGDNRLVFKVADEGPGFNYNDVPDPTAPENIEKPHGRGIFLMKQLADNISFEDEGRKVILEFNVQGN
jgi:serine/threonine-protein kinase RsbW